MQTGLSFSKRDLKNLPPFHHLNEAGQPVTQNGEPAQPSCTFWKAPAIGDIRWNIWSIGLAVADGNVSNHRFGLKLGHYLDVIEKEGVADTEIPKKVTVVEAVQILLRHRAELCNRGLQPPGWHYNTSWWYYLKDDGTVPDWMIPNYDKKGRVTRYDCVPSNEPLVITPKMLEEMCLEPERQRRRNLREKSNLYQQEFIHNKHGLGKKMPTTATTGKSFTTRQAGRKRKASEKWEEE